MTEEDMTEERVRGMKVVELKAELEKKGLSKNGAKAALANRLIESLQSEIAAEKEEDKMEGEEKENGVTENEAMQTTDEQEVVEEESAQQAQETTGTATVEEQAVDEPMEATEGDVETPAVVPDSTESTSVEPESQPESISNVEESGATEVVEPETSSSEPVSGEPAQSTTTATESTEPATESATVTDDVQPTSEATTEAEKTEDSNTLPLEPPAEELDYEETDLKDDLVSFDIEDADIAAVEQPTPGTESGGAGPATTAISGDDDEVQVVSVKKGDTKKEEEG
eukprot:sb/3467808/